MLKICYLNAWSVVNKVNELETMIKIFSYDIIFVVETWLNSTIQNSLFSLAGYSIIRRDRPDGRRGGGILVMFKSHLPVLEIRHFKEKTLEYLCVDLLPSKRSKPTRFLCCYIPPDLSRDKTCIESLCNCVKTHNVNSNFYLLGDFNMPFIDWAKFNTSSAVGNKFLDFCTENSLYQNIHESTTKKGSILDLFFCNEISGRNLISIDILDPLSPTCDHCTIEILISYENSNIPCFNIPASFQYTKGNYSSTRS